MSLLLRQQAQEILNSHELTNLHVSISTTNYLQLVGECGKPFVTITGIHFGTKTVKAAEIPFACELLDAFLTKHVQPIAELLVEVQELANTSLPILHDTVGNYHLSYFSNVVYVGLLDEKREILKIPKSGEIVTSGRYCVNLSDITGLIESTSYTEILAYCSTYFAADSTFNNQQAKVNKLKSALSSCNI